MTEAEKRPEEIREPPKVTEPQEWTEGNLPRYEHLFLIAENYQ